MLEQDVVVEDVFAGRRVASTHRLRAPMRKGGKLVTIQQTASGAMRRSSVPSSTHHITRWSAKLSMVPAIKSAVCGRRLAQRNCVTG